MSSEAISLTVRHSFRFPAERVFDAWLDPACAGKWLFATPAGSMVLAEIDPRVGGSFRFVDRRDGADVEHVGTYLEIDRPHRLVFDFGVPAIGPDRATVTVEIVSTPDGCDLTLSQTMDPAYAAYRDRTAAGWAMILEGLDQAITP
ncbi:MAG: SRPBCC domain-containing protein [Alphaproteobacteria bacterium]|nr:MAG: SRPBCC domain-containing protein [Alphaproteobacteria bacterium]